MNVSRQVGGSLRSRGLVLTTAESCTAGLIASMLAGGVRQRRLSRHRIPRFMNDVFARLP
ncbi:MAG TPA: CinA family protein [Paraburkholderia sp.]|jgi:hypothetical protein|nr:CinA family protein [Paraburkholderia sp.]